MSEADGVKRRRGGRKPEMAELLARRYGVTAQFVRRMGVFWFGGLNEDAKAVMVANHRRERRAGEEGRARAAAMRRSA